MFVWYSNNFYIYVMSHTLNIEMTKQMQKSKIRETGQDYCPTYTTMEMYLLL